MVNDLLQDPSIRLVTIVGPGGVGKSRLAVEVARALDERFSQGTFFVSLAPLDSVDEVLPALAGLLEVPLPPGRGLRQAVLEHLAERQVLLVMDNFEQLIEGAALMSAILAGCPLVKVLVTSREKLDLEAETLYHLGGLQLPAQAETLENIQESGAVRLCLQKARQVRPGFSLHEGNAPAVLRMCQVVDGNPLGILLAAAWLEYFSPGEIAQEISDNLDFLSSQARDMEPRHFGMRAVFDSSFLRLDDHLQAVLRQLSVFRGGFDLPAAGAVAGADLRALIALADKSLLARDPNSGRYEMHELLRQYAGGRLAEAGESEAVLSAHTEYYTAFVEQREGRLISSGQTAALDAIQADFDNIRQSFSRAIANRDFASVRSTLPGLYAFCDMRSRFHEGEAMFRQAAEGLNPQVGETAHGAWALALLSWFDMRMYIEPLDSYDEITSRARTCLDQRRSLGDAQGTAASLNLLGAIAQHQGDFRAAIRYCQEAMQVFPELDAVYWVNMRIGLCYEADRQYGQAIQMFLGCLERGRKTGERVKTAWSLQNIGDTLIFQGNLAEAQTHVDEALALFQQVGTPIGVLWSLDTLSRIHMGLGQLERARARATAAAQLARELHSVSWMRKTHQLVLQLGGEPGPTSIATAQPRDGEFSERELEVLNLLKSELSGPDIARTLVVSLNTVRFHTKNIYRKLGAGTRLEAIQRAKELGL